MRFYKVTTMDLRGPHNGNFRYSAPKPDGTPGDWTPNEKVSYCSNGYHVTTAYGVLYWYGKDKGNRIFEAECKWPNDTQPDPFEKDHGKMVACSIRLLKEVFLNEDTHQMINGYDQMVKKLIEQKVDVPAPPEQLKLRKDIEDVLTQEAKLREELHRLQNEDVKFNQSRAEEKQKIKGECRLEVLAELENAISKVAPQPVPVADLLSVWVISNSIKLNLTSTDNRNRSDPWSVTINASTYTGGGQIGDRISARGRDPDGALRNLALKISGQTLYHAILRNPDGTPFEMNVPTLLLDKDAPSSGMAINKPPSKSKAKAKGKKAKGKEGK